LSKIIETAGRANITTKRSDAIIKNEFEFSTEVIVESLIIVGLVWLSIALSLNYIEAASSLV